jgi:FkbM family methyltransferase
MPAMRAGVDPSRLLRYREIEAFHALRFGTVLYVGANRGQEIPLLLNAFPAAHVHCFEPGRAFKDLSHAWAGHPRCSVWPLALGAENGPAGFHVSEAHDEANSLRAPEKTMSRVFPGVGGWTDATVDVSTLDAWAANVPLTDDLLLKMDVQGAEDLVLAGADATLPRVTTVITELAITTTYEGALDAPTMLTLLHDHGFAYGGELDVVRSPVTNEVVEYDALFVRRRA